MKFGPTKPNAVKPTASPVKGQGVTGGPRPGLTNPNAVRPAPKPMPPQAGAAPTPQMAAAALRKLPMNPPMPGKAGPKRMIGLGDAMRGLGAGAAGVARGIAASDLKRAGLMKKGGAVKKATKK